MIFKTITSSVDESRKTLALFNKDWNTYKTNWQKGFSQSGFTGGVKSLFQSSNSNSVISNDQVQILRNWNNAVKHGCTNQDTFNRIIANADENTKMYFAGLNKGKASMEGLKNAQNVAKTSTIGLTVAQTALNMAISMGLMAAISLAIKGFDKLVNSAKRASEAADEAFSETNDKVQEYDDELKSLDELIVKYKEVKESGNLDLEGRKEIKEIQNDIADLVGTQAKNLDLVNGKLDDEIKKLDEISAKEAKRAYETATANYNNSQKANESATGDDSFLFADGYSYTGKREKEAEKILKDAGFGRNVQSGGFFGNTLFVMDSFDNNMKELKGAQEKADYLQSMIDVLEQNGQRATDLYAGLIQQRDDYLTYLDNQQSAANSLVNSWLTYSQFSNEELSKINVDSVESFEDYRQKMLDEAKKDESIGKVLADGTLSNEDLENTINNFMATSLNFSTWYEQWINNVQSSTSSELFSSFDNTNIGERLQHANKLFKEGELTHKQYFDSLQNEIDNFDASNFTESLEDANKASQQFFTDSVQQSASGLSDLINKFDAGEMSVSEYLDGYLAIGETLSTLADNLQENSSAWDKNGEAMSDAVSSGLDSVQSDLDNAMSTITGYKDSIYSLEQIMTGVVKAGSDEFTAHANVIAQDLANIVSSGGEMASEVANTLGTTTSEIASNLTKNVSNQSLAAQAIASNTNIAISDMATSVANIFTTLGNAISNFNVDISFSKTSGSLIDAITGNGELKFNLSASGETLSTIGDAISAFGETLALNIQPQLIEAPDFSLDVDEYTPDVDTLKNYNNELDRLKDSSKGASKSTDALTESMKKQKEALEKEKEALEETKAELEELYDAVQWFYDKQIDKLNESKEEIEENIDSWEKLSDAINWFLNTKLKKYDELIENLEKDNERLQEQQDDMDSALSAINNVIDIRINELQEEKELLQDNTEEQEKQLALEEARRKLQEARSKKSVMLYEEGKGFVYTVDQKAVKEAEDELSKLENDFAHEESINRIDDEIERLGRLKDSWNDVANAYDDAMDRRAASTLLGSNWEDKALNATGSDIEKVKDKYVGIQNSITQNENKIKGYEEEKERIQETIDLWDSAADQYEEAEYRKQLSAHFGDDYETELLNGSKEKWQEHVDRYNEYQEQLSNTESQIESIETLKQAWEDAKNAYQYAEYEKQLSTFFGSDYEYQLLNNSATWRAEYTKKYSETCEKIEELEEKIKQLSEETGNAIEETGNKAETSAGQVRDYKDSLEELDGTTAETTITTQNVTENIVVNKNAPGAVANTGRPGMTNLPSRYAKGTRNAKKGIAEVAEEGAEIVADGKNIFLAETPTLVNMQGGETVYDAKETEQILASKGLKPLDESFLQDIATLKSTTQLENFATNLNYSVPKFDLPKYDFSSLSSSNREKQTVLEFKGDIIVQGVQDVDGLARAIKDKFPRIMTQELNKK